MTTLLSPTPDGPDGPAWDQDPSALAPEESGESRPAVSIIAVAAALLTLAVMVLLMFLPGLKPWRGLSGDAKIAQKKMEDLRAADRQALDSYDGPFVDPSHKAVRIPIHRAMQLLAEESASSLSGPSPTEPAKRPVPTSSPTQSPSPEPGPSPVSAPQAKTDRSGGDASAAGASREPRP